MYRRQATIIFAVPELTITPIQMTDLLQICALLELELKAKESDVPSGEQVRDEASEHSPDPQWKTTLDALHTALSSQVGSPLMCPNQI